MGQRGGRGARRPRCDSRHARRVEPGERRRQQRARDCQPLALADYFNSACRLDAAATGFPGGEITWGTVRFQVASVPGEPGTLAGLEPLAENPVLFIPRRRGAACN